MNKNNIKKILIIILIFFSTLYLDLIIFLIEKIPHTSMSNIVTIGDRILFITFIALIWYAWETKKIREIGQEPVLLLFVRNIDDYKEEKQKQLKNYVINSMRGDLSNELLLNVKDPFLLRIRNVGNGAAFNVKIQNSNYKVEKYQAQFLAPNSDEQAIKLISENEKPWGAENLNDEIFYITCESINKKKYKFKYKIVDIEKQEVEFIK